MSEPQAASPAGGVVPGAEPVSMDGVLRGLYAVTPDVAHIARLLALSEQVLAGKPALLQYRNKTADATLRRAQARALQRLCRAAGVPFIVNDDLALALEIDADGAHLGRDDGPPAAARTALGTQRILGLTCYSDWSRATEGAEVGADYIAFGAMFPFMTKRERAARAVRHDHPREARTRPAGGGDRRHHARKCAAGAGRRRDLLAVVSDVFGAEDPAARAAAYRALF